MKDQILVGLVCAEDSVSCEGQSSFIVLAFVLLSLNVSLDTIQIAIGSLTNDIAHLNYLFDILSIHLHSKVLRDQTSIYIFLEDTVQLVIIL